MGSGLKYPTRCLLAVQAMSLKRFSSVTGKVPRLFEKCFFHFQDFLDVSDLLESGLDVRKCQEINPKWTDTNGEWPQISDTLPTRGPSNVFEAIFM